MLIRADGHIAGFALLNQWSALDRPLDRAVAEFFVVRKYRLACVGTRAAHRVFRRYPGRWEIPVGAYRGSTDNRGRPVSAVAPGRTSIRACRALPLPFGLIGALAAGSHRALGLVKIAPRPEQQHFSDFPVQCPFSLQQARLCEP
jgi:hypothetical protein